MCWLVSFSFFVFSLWLLWEDRTGIETHSYLHAIVSLSFLTVGMRGELGRCAVVFVPAIQLIRDGGNFNSSNWLYQLLAVGKCERALKIDWGKARTNKVLCVLGASVSTLPFTWTGSGNYSQCAVFRITWFSNGLHVHHWQTTHVCVTIERTESTVLMMRSWTHFSVLFSCRFICGSKGEQKVACMVFTSLYRVSIYFILTMTKIEWNTNISKTKHYK